MLCRKRTIAPTLKIHDPRRPMPQTVTGTDFTQTIDLNLAGDTPHVIVYKFFTRGPLPTDDWQPLANGSTPPTGVYHKSFSTNQDGQLYYMLGVGSFAANSPFRVALTFSQNGKLLDSGTVIWAGTADASGTAYKQDWVNFE